MNTVVQWQPEGQLREELAPGSALRCAKLCSTVADLKLLSPLLIEIINYVPQQINIEAYIYYINNSVSLFKIYETPLEAKRCKFQSLPGRSIYL